MTGGDEALAVERAAGRKTKSAQGYEYMMF